MADNIDLNALRASKSERKEERKEQKIARLTQEVAELKAKVNGPNDFEAFVALSPEAQGSCLAKANAGVSDEEKYDSVAEYAESLKPKGPDINKMRLVIKKAELEELRGS